MKYWKSERRGRWGKALGLAGALALLAAAVGAGSQPGAGGRDVLASSGATPALPVLETARVASPVLREINDPWTGARWQMQRDEEHPGGPHRLLLVDAGHAPVASAAVMARPAAPRPVIHPGDLLIVEEHTPVVDASLQAVALGQATAGSWLEVRLKLGGRVLRALALGPGRAVLQAETGGRL